MKLALLLTGHFIRRQYDKDGTCVRDFNFPSLKQHLLDKHDVDVYISTWNKSYLHNGAACEPVDTSIVLDLFKPVKYLIRDHEQYYREKKIVQFNNCMVPVNINDQERMLPKCECNHVNRDCKTIGCTAIETNADSWSMVQDCIKLVDHPDQYDYIVRARFDECYQTFPIAENVDNGSIVVPPWRKNDKWDDYIKGSADVAYGHPEDMIKYCNYINSYEELCNKNILAANIHLSLSFYLKFYCGIEQVEDPNITYTFLKD